MTQEKNDSLGVGLRGLALVATAQQVSTLSKFAKLVLEENERTNLTGARDFESLVTAHILDSLAPLRFARLESPVVDIGSGAGFPGLAAAIVHPKLNFVLIEPRTKRFAFLQNAVSTLQVTNVSLLRSSALGPLTEKLRQAAGLILMRAVADPARSMQLGLPLLSQHGQLLLYEGKQSQPTAEQRRIARRFGCRIGVQRVFVPGLKAVRHAWLISKERPKPKTAS